MAEMKEAMDKDGADTTAPAKKRKTTVSKGKATASTKKARSDKSKPKVNSALSTKKADRPVSVSPM